MLCDLPGGPPNNEGAADEDVIYDIVDEAYQNDELDSDESESANESPQQQVPQMSYQERLGFQVQQASQPQTQSHLRPPRFQPRVQSQTPQRTAVPTDIEVFTSQIRDTLIVAGLVYFSNTEVFHSLLGRLVPLSFKTVDDETQLVIVNTLAVSLAIGGLFYIVKVYTNPPNVILRFIQMYYS